MQLAHEAQRERQLAQAREPVLERLDVVADLAQIVGVALGRGRRDLVHEQLGECRPRALDARREHRLLAKVRRDEQVRIGELLARDGEFAQGRVGARQGEHEVLAVVELGRQRRRDERVVALRRLHDPAGCAAMELSWVHVCPCVSRNS